MLHVAKRDLTLVPERGIITAVLLFIKTKTSMFSNKTALLVGALFILLTGYGVSQAAVLLAEENQTKEHEQTLKDKRSYFKNLQSELNQYKKQVKAPATLDTAAADALVSKVEACLQLMQSNIGTEEFWNAQRDCNDLERDLQDAVNPVREAANCFGNRRNVEDRRKEKKNIDSQVKNILRNNKDTDISELQKVIDGINAQFAAFDALGTACSAEIGEKVNDIQNELNSLFQDFYSVSGDVNRVSEDARRMSEGKKDFEKNIKKQCEKEMGRRVKEIDKEYARAQKKLAADILVTFQEGYDKLKALYEQLCGTSGYLTQMQTALQNNSIDDFESARQEFWNAQRDFWDVSNDAQNGIGDAERRAESLKNATRDLKQKTKDIARIQKEFARMKKQYTKLANKYLDRADLKDALTAFNEFVNQSQALVDKIAEGLETAKQEAEQNPDDYWYEHGEDLNDLLNEFNDIQNRWNMTTQVFKSLQGAGKEVERARREIAAKKRDPNADQDLIAQMEDLVSRSSELLTQAWTAVLTDPETAMDTLRSLEELGREWDELQHPDAEFDFPSQGGGIPQAPTPTATFGEPSR